MNENKAKKLCLALMRADSKDEVIRLLKEVGYWDNQAVWRLYGDKEGNFAQAGNQQSLPEAALVEKIINSIDARLMAECLVRKIEPESDVAPRSVRDAVAMFFENRQSEDDEAGTLAKWSQVKRREQSRYITLAVTGDRPTQGRRSCNMCLTIVDQGEGQSPRRLPSTILSLNAKNKQRIRFVQGKFNMGGSGALRFCESGLQLVISRRCPTLLGDNQASDPSASQWGFTVVRREEPSNKCGQPVHSEFTYLAPIGANKAPKKGEVLSFTANTLPVMPQKDEPYAREVEWATVIKLYEYETNVGQSHILLKDGLLFSLERLMPEIALPVRLHECRGYGGGKERSFETSLSGLVVRLEEGKGDNLESGFPISVKLRAANMAMKARIYAFKEDKASTYLENEGVIFMINGQAHGYLPKSIFSRPKAVGLPRLKDSLLMLVDCSSLPTVQREDLFMSSRDRLSKRPIRSEIESEIEVLLRNSVELKKLQNERRNKDTEGKLSEDKPLEEVLRKVLKSSPTLKTLFLQGQRLAKPFARRGGAKAGDVERPEEPDLPFEGLRHPTFFRFVKHEYGKELRRNCEVGRRCYIEFETDVENGYFDRSTYQGSFDLEIIDAPRRMSPPSFSMTLEDGFAYLSMALPPEVEAGDYLVVQVIVSDPTLLKPFVNVVRLNVMPLQTRKSGSKTDPKSEGISLPKVITVREGDEHWDRHKFTQETASKVITELDEENGKERLVHTFYVNADNKSLKTEMKYSKQDPRLLEGKFKYGNVLLGIAMLHEEYYDHCHQRNGQKDDPKAEEERDNVEERIGQVTQAVAPVLIPIIDQLSGLNEDDLDVVSQVGEDD